MRTLLRPGRFGALVKIEGRRGTRFVVRGPAEKDRRVFFDLDVALRWFERVERGLCASAPTGEPRDIREAALSTAP